MVNNVNQKCFFRKQVDCNQDFSEFDEKNICFIACPTSDEIALEISIIKSVLLSEGIIPFIASEEDRLNEDIPCSKICKYILGSLFCIVILNEVSPKVDEKNPCKLCKQPNANVFFEYGMMTALNKNVIPLLKKGQKPQFDVQSLGLIMYDELSQETVKAFTDRIRDQIKEYKNSESQLGEANRRFLNNFEEETRKNYELILLLRNWSGSMFNEPMWSNIIRETKKIRKLYYDKFKDVYSLTLFSEKDAKLITDCYEDLIRLTEKAQDSLDEFPDNKLNNPYQNDLNGGDFRRELIKLTDGLEKTLLILNKENEAYIKEKKQPFNV